MKNKREILDFLDELSQLGIEIEYSSLPNSSLPNGDMDYKAADGYWQDPEVAKHALQYHSDIVDSTFSGGVIFHIRGHKQTQSFFDGGDEVELEKVSSEQIVELLERTGLQKRSYSVSRGENNAIIVKFVPDEFDIQVVRNKIKVLLPELAVAVAPAYLSFRFESTLRSEDRSSVQLLDWSTVEKASEVFKRELHGLALRNGLIEFIIGDYSTIVWRDVASEEADEPAKQYLLSANSDLALYGVAISRVSRSGGSAVRYTFGGELKILK